MALGALLGAALLPARYPMELWNKNRAPCLVHVLLPAEAAMNHLSIKPRDPSRPLMNGKVELLLDGKLLAASRIQLDLEVGCLPRVSLEIPIEGVVEGDFLVEICAHCETTGIILNGDMSATPCPECLIGKNLRAKLSQEPAKLSWDRVE